MSKSKPQLKLNFLTLQTLQSQDVWLKQDNVPFAYMYVRAETKIPPFTSHLCTFPHNSTMMQLIPSVFCVQ